MIYSEEGNQEKYPFILPDLPFKKEEFAPHFSAETFDYHHGKHHQAYVTNLNKLLENKTEFHDKTLEEIILFSDKRLSEIDYNENANFLGNVFNNAAQIWNHTFFWHSISPKGGGEATGKLLDKINKDFGSYEEFIKQFKDAALNQFGSGWAWLVENNDYRGKLSFYKTSNADTPITFSIRPLIACDVWEHAYYIDYRNKRPDYIDVFLKNMINWEFANKNFSAGSI